MLELDQILKANQINFATLAALPACFIVFLLIGLMRAWLLHVCNYSLWLKQKIILTTFCDPLNLLIKLSHIMPGQRGRGKGENSKAPEAALTCWSGETPYGVPSMHGSWNGIYWLVYNQFLVSFFFFFYLAFDALFHNWLIESQLFLYDITRGLIWST